MVTQVLIAFTFIIYVAIFAIFRLEPRITIAMALSLLAAAAITLVTGFTDLSNHLANYGYFLLVAGVFLLLLHQHFTVVPEDKLKEWVASWSSRLSTFKLSISGMVRRGNERESVRRTYSAARVAERRFEVLIGARLERKDQMMKAKAIQDELRERCEGREEAEVARKWRNETIQVLDASVIVNWFSKGENTEKALEVRQRILDGEMKMVIPDLALYEVATALRHNPDFDEDDVVAAVESVLDMGLEVVAPISSLAKASARLASRHRISLYDAFYVALASELGTDFITADKGLYESLKQLEFVKLIGKLDEPEI